MNFQKFLETDNEAEWHRLFEHCLKWYKGAFKPSVFPIFHENLVRLLKNVGMDNEANELEMIKPSQEDLEFGATPSGGLGMNLGDVLKHAATKRQRESFEAAYRAYSRHLENIMDIIEQKSEQMGWAARDRERKDGVWM